MSINWQKERADYDATIQTELNKLGVSNLDSLKDLSQSTLHNLDQDFKSKRNEHRYGGVYEAYDHLMLTCSSHLPLFEETTMSNPNMNIQDILDLSDPKKQLNNTSLSETKKTKSSTVSPFKQGHSLNSSAPTPYPEPIDGPTLLDQIIQSINTYMIMDNGCPEATALWILHSYLLDAFTHSPRLAITSPEKGCGKTTLLDILADLTPRALPTANTTPAAIFRAIEHVKPTLLIDEADTFLSKSDDLRGILNSGHRKATAYVLRTVGDEHEPRRFSTWAATAIAMIGDLPETLADRSIPIRLRRRMQHEKISSFRSGRSPEIIEICSKAIRWAQDNFDTISKSDPIMPEGLYNRSADNWAPLLAIADQIGSEWPQRAREIALKLSQQNDPQNSIGIMALTDIRQIFNAQGADKISSGKLLSEMKKLDGRPWNEDERGRELSPNRLAKILKPFGLFTENLRVKDEKGIEKVIKGFRREAFELVWEQYLPPLSEDPSDS